jgi:hypothetical protein
LRLLVLLHKPLYATAKRHLPVTLHEIKTWIFGKYCVPPSMAAPLAFSDKKWFLYKLF